MTGVLGAIAEHGVVPVVAVDDADQARRLLEALLRAGLPLAEITLRTQAGLGAIRVLAQEYPEAVIGAGTVRTLAEAEQVIAAGASFVVSPGTYPELIETCGVHGTPVLPGVCTPTEVDAAVRAGATVVKLFPAEVAGGVALLRALSGPFADVRFVPTGGIDATNLGAYLAVPSVVACGGSWFVAPSLLRRAAFDEVESLAREAVTIAQQVRHG